jgi:hypothetical protein
MKSKAHFALVERQLGYAKHETLGQGNGIAGAAASGRTWWLTGPVPGPARGQLASGKDDVR